MPLFKRIVNVTVGPKTAGAPAGLSAIEKASGLDVSNLDCVFKCKKNLKPKPNTCDLKIFNLAASSRKLLETPKKLVLRLEAGYESTGTAQLFLGEIRRAQSTRDGQSIVTHIETGDSEKELQTAHISLSIGPKVPVTVALQNIAQVLKVGPGNIAVAGAKLAAKGVAPFGPGSIIFGDAERALTDICKSADLEWSIQDSVIQILDRGKALEGLAVLLSSSTGLIGSPTIDHKGIVTAKALIQPDLRPGHKVTFDTIGFKIFQGYRIEEAEYEGDTSGQPWYVTMKCKPY